MIGEFALRRSDVEFLIDLLHGSWEAYSEGDPEGEARHNALIDKLHGVLVRSGSGAMDDVIYGAARLKDVIT